MSRGSTNGTSRRRTVPARVPITIRLPENVVNQIDLDLGQRDVPLSRNNWLLEAALEKLRKRDAGESHGTK